uniref:Uncharacterized protein n=1 Tax=Dromaius novaehollandiae TaxID=8790 RepID=A0A8C4K6A2_DRONO
AAAAGAAGRPAPGSPAGTTPAPAPAPAAAARSPPRRSYLPDGDVHRHLYLQDVLTSVTEVAERSNTNAWWKAAQRSSRAAKTERITWSPFTFILLTFDLIDQKKLKGNCRIAVVQLFFPFIFVFCCLTPSPE